MSYYGLGTLPAVTSVVTNTRSAAVRTLQAKLSALGFLPASGVDGFFGPQTINALGAAARSVGYTGETVRTALVGSTYHYTVTTAALNAIDAAVATASPSGSTSPASVTPPAAVDPTLVGPGDQAVLDQAAADQAAASTSPPGTPDYKMYAAIGVGVLALIGGAVYLSKKPAAAASPAAVKANRRRLRRNGVDGAKIKRALADVHHAERSSTHRTGVSREQAVAQACEAHRLNAEEERILRSATHALKANFFGPGSGRYELRTESGKVLKRLDAGWATEAQRLADKRDEGISVIDTQTGEEKEYFGAPMRSNRRRVRRSRRRAA